MKVSSRGQKTICIPVASEIAYGEILEDLDQFRAYLDQTVLVLTDSVEILIPRNITIH